jgi:hypothetical protein
MDVMNDPGMRAFREAWRAAGNPLPPEGWRWQHQADERHDGPLVLRIVNGATIYAREHFLQLGASVLGLGSPTPEGEWDPVGGTIGSLDQITVYPASDDMVFIRVYNEMGWSSGTRIPGTDVSILDNRSREQWGPGGTIEQYFYWFEPAPTQP